MDVPVGELDGREPGDRVGAHRVERDVAEVQQAGVAHDDVEADGHHRVDAHDHGRAEIGIRTEDVHAAEVRDVERIREDDDEDDRRNEEPAEAPRRRRHALRPVRNCEQDGREDPERPVDREDEEEDDGDA